MRGDGLNQRREARREISAPPEGGGMPWRLYQTMVDAEAKMKELEETLNMTEIDYTKEGRQPGR